MTRIMIMCNDTPGYGGAATNAYNLIKVLRKHYGDVKGLFFSNNSKAIIDPDNICGIVQCPEYPFACHKSRHIINKIINDMGTLPSFILCKNSTSVKYARIMYPSVGIVYLCPGPKGILNINDINNIEIEIEDAEKQAIQDADTVIFNGEFTKDKFIVAFPEYVAKFFDKIVNTSIHHTIFPEYQNTPKTNDIIIASSILTRQEKNNLFLLDILNHKECEKYSKIIVGNDNDPFLNVANSMVYDLMSQKQLSCLLSESKLLVFPSVYDSNPSTVLEALYYGCSVLVSSNLDISKLLPEEYVCNSFSKKVWKDKIINLLDAPISHDYKDQNNLTIAEALDILYPMYR